MIVGQKVAFCQLKIEIGNQVLLLSTMERKWEIYLHPFIIKKIFRGGVMIKNFENYFSFFKNVWIINYSIAHPKKVFCWGGRGIK